MVGQKPENRTVQTAYFITICTQNRECYFGAIVDKNMILSEIGTIVQTFWKEIPTHFPFVELGEFVVMPNHMHGIIIINQYKRICTIHSRKIHADFGWQSRFHDHIIRNDESFQRISEYIQNNPVNWHTDKFHDGMESS